MINLFYDCYRVLNKVYGEGAYLKRALLDVDIEEKNRAATTKICYGVLDKDYELSYAIKYLAPKTPRAAVRTVLKTAMYTYKYLGKKPYAVADAAVELVKKLGKGGAAGFVNAFLRKYFKTDIPLPEEISERLSAQYSYPLFAVKELLKEYGKERAEKIVSAENCKTTLAFYGTDGAEYLKNLGAEYEKTPFDNVFTLKNFVRNEDYDKGVYTYQALPSVAICEAVEPCEKLLDCCAAPGGKSVRLSFKCKEIMAWDVHPHRVELISAYKRRMGRENIKEEARDATKFYADCADKFDAVLCDCPCSGTGVINDNPDIKLNREAEDVVSLVKTQTAILDNAAKYVKKGGYLYYSTCSVLKSENSDVAEEFLKGHENYEICPINSPLPHEDKKGANAFLPDISGGLGFFVAKFKRVK